MSLVARYQPYASSSRAAAVGFPRLQSEKNQASFDRAVFGNAARKNSVDADYRANSGIQERKNALQRRHGKRHSRNPLNAQH
mmetsp:Transcript_56700/g.117104  ORF Transcript_56700/g.117104 Transcript_56700/m.117104 type:complete len:82 (+) Transcript_56700:523-768(+)